MGIIIYNGRSSKDYHIQVETPPGYDVPKRDIDYVHIPGRNGNVLFDRGSYENVDRTYEVSFGNLEQDFQEMANKLSTWLHSSTTYARLEDSYDPSCFRLAIYKDNLRVENILSHGGKADLTFDCKPQRFLKSGEKQVTFTGSGILKNPTEFDASPLIKVYGSGACSIKIGSYSVSFSSVEQYLYLDSDRQEVYSYNSSNQLVNKNPATTLSNGFPKLIKDTTSTISFSGGVTKLEVIPRWWML